MDRGISKPSADADKLAELREQLGVNAILHELRRMERLLRHRGRTPREVYDDLEISDFDDYDDED